MAARALLRITAGAETPPHLSEQLPPDKSIRHQRLVKIRSMGAVSFFPIGILKTDREIILHASNPGRFARKLIRGHAPSPPYLAALFIND